jgi:very-short-patch-repair endonuclease
MTDAPPEPPRKGRPTSRARSLATKLRKAPTEAERRLWRLLREKLPLNGTHFRRQAPIGPYVADFCALKARLVIEVDGNQHGEDATAAHDLRRDAFLRAEGFKVLRFSNRQVFTEPDMVIDTIFAALGDRAFGAEASD